MQPVFNVVRARNIPNELDDAALVDRVDMLCSGLAGQQSQDAGSRSEIHHDIARPDHFTDRLAERSDPGPVGKIFAVFIDD